jgi:hypothetical protein
VEQLTDSGLWAVYRSASSKRIDRELRAIDPRLFLDPEYDQHWGLFWTVKFWNGERAPDPVTVVADWREPSGQPRDLSDGLLYEVQRMIRRGPIDPKKIAQHNQELRERRANQTELDYERAAISSVQQLRVKPLFHRSQGLRIARDRARRRGEQV